MEFYATGKDPLAGAVAGVAGEGTAMLAGKVLGKSPSQLTEEERDMLKTAAQLAGAIAGGAAGDSMATTVAGLETAKRAVENNYLYRQEAEELLNLRLALQLTTNAEEKEKIQTRINELEKLDQDRQEHIKTACPDFGKSSSACSAAIADAEKAKASYNGWTDQYQPVGYNSKDKRPYTTIFTQDYGRVNEALVGKDELTRQKEELALDLAKSGKMSKEEAYRILDNSMTLSDTLMALGGIKTVSNEKFMAFLTGKYKLPVMGKTQGYEYSDVRISSGAENIALYQKLKADLAEQQQKGFEKVIKDLSKKPEGSVLILSDYRQKLAEAKIDLPIPLQRKGNAAIAQVDIEGLDVRMLAGHSQIDANKGIFVGEGKTEFKSLMLPTKNGKLVDRKTDSEYKILSNLADQLGSNTQARGQVIIFTERPACASCLGVAEQFNKRYPNININIFDNNGKQIQSIGVKE